MQLSSDSIKVRSSIRTYDNRPLSAPETEALLRAIEECGPAPLGPAVTLRLVSAGEAGMAGGAGTPVKLGTYGTIKGAPAFIVGSVPREAFANEAFGYCLEGVVLRAAELGLGTCWLGGSLHRSQVASLLGAGTRDLIPCMTPVGAASESRSLMDKLIRRQAKPENRKPYLELFFEGEPGHPLEFDPASPLGAILEAVRRGPSASNKQPWRIVKSGPSGSPVFHLLLDEDKAYNSIMGEVKMQNIDMGIAMRHFEVEARHQGFPGSWRRLSSTPLAESAPLRYIATWA